MDIYLNEYKQILDHLVKERWEGMEYVTFLTGSGPVSKEGLFTFIDHYEAQEYCSDNSTDLDAYAYLPIRSVYRCMSEALEDKSLLVEKDGVVDISAMVDLHYERLSEKAAISDQNSAGTEQNELVTNEKTTAFFEKDIETKIEAKLAKRSENKPSTDRQVDGLRQQVKKIPLKKIAEMPSDKRKHQMKRRK